MKIRVIWAKTLRREYHFPFAGITLFRFKGFISALITSSEAPPSFLCQRWKNIGEIKKCFLNISLFMEREVGIEVIRSRTCSLVRKKSLPLAEVFGCVPDLHHSEESHANPSSGVFVACLIHRGKRKAHFPISQALLDFAGRQYASGEQPNYSASRPIFSGSSVHRWSRVDIAVYFQKHSAIVNSP